MRKHRIALNEFFPPSMEGPSRFMLAYSQGNVAVVLEREHPDEDTNAAMLEEAELVRAGMSAIGRRQIDKRRAIAENT